MQVRSILLPALAITAFATSAPAQITHLQAPAILGTMECPPVLSTASGTANVTVNETTHVLNFHVTISMLVGAETAAHLHNPPSATCSGPPMFSLPLGPVKTGSFATTPAQEAVLLGGDTYTNIHTTAHGTGEAKGKMALAPAVGTSLCFGDGTGGACPCGNSGAAGKGCENSASTGGALLKASGFTTPDNVVLIVSGELPTVLTIFLQGDVLIAPVTFGDGLRCVGGALKRLSAKSAAGGWVAYPEGAEMSITARSAALGDPIPPGGTRHYMTYYRDPMLGFCPTPLGNSWNSSQAVSITW